MKIAAVSDDGVTISRHFGRAPMYVVVTVEDGTILSRENRDKMGHAQFAGEHQEGAHEADPRGHGFDPARRAVTRRMILAIADCEVPCHGGWARALRQHEAGRHTSNRDGRRRYRCGIRALVAGTLVNHVEHLH